MAQPIIGKNVTLGGNTITIESVEPSDDFEELLAKGSKPTGEPTTVAFKLDEKTGDGNLELLFSGACVIERKRNHAQTIFVDDGDRSAYYANPYIVE